MDKAELLEDLRRIIREYLPTQEAEDLMPDVCGDKVRYVLVQLDQRKTKDITNHDREKIKDIVFYFG